MLIAVGTTTEAAGNWVIGATGSHMSSLVQFPKKPGSRKKEQQTLRNPNPKGPRTQVVGCQGTNENNSDAWALKLYCLGPWNLG